MKNKVLDCTLRDGGYVNDWGFGEKNIKKIIEKLVEANIDIIECGFLSNKNKFNKDVTIFDDIKGIRSYLPKTKKDNLFVCMINYGEYELDELPINDNKSIQGIRIAFHKKDMVGALEYCKALKAKGYKIFLQPMVSLSYTDDEFIKLIKASNKINPYAFYIVDSFGAMNGKDIKHLFKLVDCSLNKNIHIGFHSHNNIQMSFSNTQTLFNLKTKRNLIIDSSVFGMGRGAGNLNTEIFIEYLNEYHKSNYKLKPLLEIIDQILANIYINNYWGYSLPYYISAKNNCHPNYATYLDEKNTLNIENINDILKKIEKHKKNVFDNNYIQELYDKYQEKSVQNKEDINQLRKIFKNKTILIIAPGKSISLEKKKIKNVMSQKNTITISVNFLPNDFSCDYVFISNKRRYKELINKSQLNLIITSNITPPANNCFVVDYSDLTNDVSCIEDNSTMMLIKLLIELKVENIKLAGLDGYSHELYENFVDKNMAFIKKPLIMDDMNNGMTNMLNIFSKDINIEFVTFPRYVKLLPKEKG